MYCTNCGQPRPDDAVACANCGARVQRFAAPGTIPNYLVQSILVTLCCCLPFGVVAVIYAAQVNSKLAAGDIAGAQAASKNAKMWAWLAFGAGVLISILSFAFGLLDALNKS
jgi:interferon-induced transmembrane protein/zinc ribbon protein